MKYIVYLTTNIINNKIYVGVHQTENPDVFDGYLGNGINMFECNSELKHPKYPIHKAIKKYGYSAFKRQTIKVFDTKQEALDLEAFIVDEDFIKRDDTYNIALNKTYSKPPKRKVKGDIHQYDLDGNYIKTFTSKDELKKEGFIYGSVTRAIREDASYKQFIWICGEKLDKVPPKHTCKARKIGQYTMEGELVKIWNTMRECKKEFPNVSKVLRGQAKHCHNYFFKYEE
jgi:hypothetical protein